MAKESGLGFTTLSVADAAAGLQDIRNDVPNFQFATPRGVQDVTGIDKFAFERLLLLADMSMTLNGIFNDAANKSHDVFKSVPTFSGGRAVQIAHSGNNLGITPAIAMIATDYALARANGGELTWTVPMALSNGVIPTWA